MPFPRNTARQDSQYCSFLQLLGHPKLFMKQKLGQPTSSSLSQILRGRVRLLPKDWFGPPHLHLNIGVGQVVLWRQLAVIIDKVVQDGGAQDGLQGREGVRKGTGGQDPKGHSHLSCTR